MSEPRWLTLEQVKVAHDKQLKKFGGAAGLRDLGMLESAIGRPVNRFFYGETDLAALAASWAFGLIRNHAFVDGNKRIAFVAMVVFLRKNSIMFAPDQAQATNITFALASGEVSEESLARWIRNQWPKR